jgi:hypothetical protein
MDPLRKYETHLPARFSQISQGLSGDIRSSRHRWTRLLPLAFLVILLVLGTLTFGGRKGGNILSNGPAGAAKGGTTASDTTPQLATVLQSPTKHPVSARAKLDQKYTRLPLTFEANQGQAPNEVKFISRGTKHALFLTTDAAILAMPRSFNSSQRRLPEPAPLPNLLALGDLNQPSDGNDRQVDEGIPSILWLRLIGLAATTHPRGQHLQQAKSNYFIGHNPANWHTNISNYARVNYPGVYPGVDLVYYGNQRRLEYDFIVSPGADPQQIAWKFEGDTNSTAATTLDAQGNLLVSVGEGVVRLDKPVAYEISAGKGRRAGHSRLYLDARYMVKEDGQFGFAVAGHDPSKTLVIDPVLEYSTYLGGSSDDLGFGIAVDSSDNAYVTGQTLSTNFPITAGSFQTTCASCSGANKAVDAFVTKFNSSGTLVYSTYLGGNSTDSGFGIAVDPAGNAYITGQTLSTNFPVTALAFQSTCSSCASFTPDAFVTKLNPTGSALVFSTYLGGNASDQGFAIAADSNGNSYITGFTQSTNFPTHNSLPAPNNFLQGTQNAFVTEFDSSGNLVSSTYLGGSGFDTGYGVAADSTGIYVAGETSSNNFPTVNPFQGAFKGVNDAFVSKLAPGGASLIYSTYLGGTSNNGARAIATDSAGDAYVTGTTNSGDFPVTPGVFQPTFGGGSSNAFVTVFNSLGSQLIYSTYLGGNGFDQGLGIGVDASFNANVVGQTTSTNFPTANPVQAAYATNTDAFVTRFVRTGCAPTFSTYLGGHATDIGNGIAVDSTGNAFVTGQTSSNDFPVSNGAFQPATGGGLDAFVSQLSFFSAPALCLSDTSLQFSGQALTTTSPQQTITLQNSGNQAMTISSIVASGPFAQTNNCPTTQNGFAVAANCMINVTFSPTSAGQSPASAITITDTAGGSPQTIALSGTGTDFSLSVVPTTTTVTAGQTAPFTLTVSPTDGFNGTVNLTCSGAPLNADCAFQTNSVTLNGMTSVQVPVNVTTKARSEVVPFPGPGNPNPTLLLTIAFFLVLSSAIFIAHARVFGYGKGFNAATLVRVAALIAVLTAALIVPACGFKNNTPKGTPAGNYPMTFTGTDGTLQHLVQATLTVN